MSMKDNGAITKEMDEENSSGKMAAFMKDTGKIIWPMVLED